MRKLLFLCLCLLALVPAPQKTQAAPLLTPSQVIAEVNALRAGYGLPPLSVDSILMSIAQTHSDYQASIGTITHTGPGGTRPRDRAYAAGYGGGGTIFLSENIAGGFGRTPAEVVASWTGDAPHLNTMIGAYYTDIGAGVATDSEGRVYYTIDVGYKANAPASNPTPIGNPIPTLSAQEPGENPGTGAAIPVIAAEPNKDGSVIHVVEQGQALYTIAVVYEISLQELYTLNGMNENTVIYPGDKIIIREGYTPTPTATATNTGTPPPPPTRTPHPSRTPAPEKISEPDQVAAASADSSPTPARDPVSTDSPGFQEIAPYALAGLVVLAGLLVAVGNMLEKTRQG